MRAAWVLVSVVATAWAVRESEFRRKVDTHNLAESWKEDDVEDEEWHEDTYDWREKDRAKNQVPFDPKNPNAFLQRAMAGSGMQMIFVTLKPETHVSKQQTAELGTRWQSLLRTDGVQVSVYPIDKNQLLLSQEDGRVLEVQNFILKQPETLKSRWKDQDQYPPGVTATPEPRPKKVKKVIRRVKGKGKGEGGEASEEL